jgi:hypothetical protein
MLSYIVTNKWLRSGYGEPLRKFFVEQTIFEQIIDFGHAPIFRDADTFPCIIVLQKADGARGLSPLSGELAGLANQVTVCAVPREQLEGLNLAQFVEREGYEIPRSRLSAAAWSLENPQVDALMQKIRSVGVPLVDFAGTKPLLGIKTGLNEAFLIDEDTRKKIIDQDPNASSIIRPYLRGQDLERWSPYWSNLWIIFLKSSHNFSWKWHDQDEISEKTFHQEFPSIYNWLRPFKEKLQRRQDKGKYWWELRSCSFYERFECSKIIYQEIQYHPSFCWDNSGNLTNNKCFIIPTSSKFLLAALCSPIIWWHNWQYLPHMKDEALTPAGFLMEKLPIAPPTEPIRREAEDLVSELIELTQANQEAQRDVIGWLAFEFNIDKPGQKLADFAQLSLDEFRAELKKRCPKGTSIGPKQVKAIDLAYSDYATPIQQRNAEILRREQRLSDLVNQAYQLTPEEIELLWKTAPPRMPIAPPN